MNTPLSRAPLRKTASRIAFAIALVTGGAVAATTLATPAHAAQKKGKEQAAAKQDFSEGFIAVAAPLQEQVNAEGGDVAALRAAAPQLVAAAQTPDDRFTAGNMVYTIGQKANDSALKRQGLGLMLESGRLPAENLASYNYLAGQLAYQDRDFPAARQYVTAAIDAGYAQNDPYATVAETYFQENDVANGLQYLERAIEARKAAGQKVDENWIKRGLSVAYEAQMDDAAFDYATMLVEEYPSPTAWGDSMAILRNAYDFDDQTLLDLLRLGQRTDSLRQERDYLEYIEAADVRRLPGEVDLIIADGLQSGLIDASNPFVAENRSQAQRRIPEDKADLPEIEAEARASSADALAATAAGDVFLSYQQPAKAEAMYAIALTKPGVDTQRVMTRLGIAQVDQGKTAEALETFGKIQGDRRQIARLWELYARQQGG